MVKSDTLWVIAAIIIAVVVMGKQQPTTTTVPTSTNGGVDLCKLVESEALFTGQRMFLKGTALTSSWVRVIRLNGDGSVNKDLGQVSMNSGTTDTSPKANYKLYYGENSSTYYTAMESYTAPCSDATDDLVGVLCTIDSTPTVTVFDEYGNVQSVSANAQSIAADEEKEVSVRVRVSADQCYGNPDAANKDKTNAICFLYHAGNFTSVKAIDIDPVSTPYIIAKTNLTNGYTGSATYTAACFKLPLLADNGQVDIPVRIVATSSFTAAESNISVILDDIAFDLDADTLEEIWDFQDEDNNELGTTSTSGQSGKIWLT